MNKRDLSESLIILFEYQRIISTSQMTFFYP